MTTKRTRPAPAAEDFFPTFMRSGFDAGALMAMSERNFQAFQRSAGLMSEAAIEIGSAQLALLRSLAETPAPAPASAANPLADTLSVGMANGQKFALTALKQMRETTERVRQCYYDVASEIESCARDNMAAAAKSSEEAPAQQEAPRPKAVGE